MNVRLAAKAMLMATVEARAMAMAKEARVMGMAVEAAKACRLLIKLQ